MQAILGMSKSLMAASIVLASAVTSPAWAWQTGRMTGGGSIFCSVNDGQTSFRVTHGFELHCQPEGQSVPTPNNLEINWLGGNNFHLTALTMSLCTYQGDPSPPAADFNTMQPTGTGTLNGAPASIEFTLTDFGEPGSHDFFGFRIVNAAYQAVLTCGANLDRGNQQAHNVN
ncbi:MAG: hypothetical protein ACJ8G7_15535 [Rhizobacter sp.]